MPEFDLREAYRSQRDVLLEACNRLEHDVLSSLEGVPGSACSFRVIELDDFLRSASDAEGGAQEPWRDSDELIVGTVTATTPDDLQEAKRQTAELFTRPHKEVRNVGDAESRVVFLIPPWAKPTSWSGAVVPPVRLTIQFVLKGGPVKQDAVKLSPFQPLSLSLSGGGLRATLFQLGILVFLAEQNRLKDVQEIVSVSGGSILSAHFLKHWLEATSGTDGFRSVAARLLKETQSNIRNSVVIPWLWSRLVPWWWRSASRGRTGRLMNEYFRIFGSTTLGELAGENRPNIAIVATDAIRQHRVAFTASEILQWPLTANDSERYATPAPIISKGVELALAVTASSCFPPVFKRLHLTNGDLGCTYAEFKETLDLNDGGVLTNLGIEVLVALRKVSWANETLILIADAECPQSAKPGGSPKTDVDASGAALSKAAKDLARHEFGPSGLSISFSDRAENPEGLTHRTETVLAGYRTDLDAPTWQEIHALMIHGAMIARRATEGRLTDVSPTALKAAIAAIIVQAGGPRDLPVPDHKTLMGCGRYPKRPVVLHLIGILFVIAALCCAASVICFGHPQALARLLGSSIEKPAPPYDDHPAPDRGKTLEAHKEEKGAGALQLKYIDDPKIVFDDTSPGFTLQTSLKAIAPLLTEPDKVFQDEVQPFRNKPIAGDWPGTLEEVGPPPKSPKEARKFVLKFGNTLKAECYLRPGRIGDELQTLEKGVATVTLTGGIIAKAWRESHIDPVDFTPKPTAVFHILNCEHKPL